MGKIVDNNGRPVENNKPEQIVEKIPENLLNPILDCRNKDVKLNQELYRTSIQVIALQKKQVELYDKITNNQKSQKNKIDRAYKKMKLDKKKNVNWGFNQKDSFVGIVKPEKKKK